jgi:ribonuclease HI
MKPRPLFLLSVLTAGEGAELVMSERKKLWCKIWERQGKICPICKKAIEQEATGDQECWLRRMDFGASKRDAANLYLVHHACKKEFAKLIYSKPGRDWWEKQRHLADPLKAGKNTSDEKRDGDPVVIAVVFDGGGYLGPAHGPIFGSLRITMGDEELFLAESLDLGMGTSNDAEFVTLIVALEKTLGLCAEDGIDSKRVELHAFGDSQLVVRALVTFRSPSKIKAPNLKPLRDEAKGLSEQFGAFDIFWQPREKSVEVLGH